MRKRLDAMREEVIRLRKKTGCVRDLSIRMRDLPHWMRRQIRSDFRIEA
jgi:hypothetical protein